jgi:hypothetical protein
VQADETVALLGQLQEECSEIQRGPDLGHRIPRLEKVALRSELEEVEARLSPFVRKLPGKTPGSWTQWP